MGGFYTGSDDVEVENLLNQLEEESLLKLKVNSHRTTTGVKLPSNSSDNVVEATDGLDHDLLSRFANLKSRPPGGVKSSRGGQSAATAGSSLEPGDGHDDGEDDELPELEVRLNALKAQESLPKKSSSAVASSVTSTKPLKPSKSFSPMKLVKQLSMGRKKKKSGSEGSVAGLDDSMSDVDKLLASAADEVALEKKNRTGKLEPDDVDEDDEDDLDAEDDLDDRLLKDLNLKMLKKELTVASLEEDRLSREAQQVIQWAKDAARLESATSAKGEEDSDMEELLQAGEEEKLSTSAKKKKKGKKWNLF